MAYREMASLYDQFMSNAPYNQWVSFTEEIFKKTGKTFKNIVDLGCGTGEITTRMANRGYLMTGVDYSSDMLTYAEQKASDQGLTIQWLNQDLRSLHGLKNMDAAISYCDVINYITSEVDLKEVFQRVADSLNNGGLFIFDVHSENHVKHNLVNNTFADVTEDSSYIWFCSEGEASGEMYHDLTFFHMEGNKYRRFDESHHQRTFSINKYKELLAEANLEIVHLHGDFSLKNESLDEDTERIFFVTEKRSR